MAAKILKTITGRWISCVLLLTALIEQGPGVAAKLLESVTPHLREGDIPPDFLASIIGRVRRLQGTMSGLLKADHVLFNINALLTALREKRAAGNKEVGSEIVDLRRHVESHHKEAKLLSLGLESPRERRAEPLLRQAMLINDVFEGEDLEEKLGASRFENDLDPRVVSRRIGKAATKLQAVVDEIHKVERHYDEALVKKDEIQKEHDNLFIYTARSFEADCHQAGAKELAKRVRPSEDRPGEIEVLPDPTDLPPVPVPGETEPGILTTPTMKEEPSLTDCP